MQIFDHKRMGITQGSRVLFSDFADNGPMWSGSGPRAQRFDVRFEDNYQSPPMVQVALNMWDMDHKHNQRMDISAEEITTTGFTLVFKTWGDSRVARVRASWLVIGALAHEDDWEIS